MNYQSEFKLWKKYLTDPKSKKELEAFTLEQIKEIFSSSLEFGTAGVRTFLGLGPSQMNIYTVRKITYAFAKVLLEKHGQKNMSNYGVVVFHDARHFSLEFAQETCRVFSSFRIKSFIVAKNETGTTPFTSYVIRQMRTRGGVMITASHNPKEYNGYKAYNEYGAQILPDEAKLIKAQMDKIKNIFDLEIEPKPDFINEISDDYIHNYIETVKNIQLNSDLARKIKVVFSPQHGVSGPTVLQILTEAGYDVVPVREHMVADPDFTYTKNPNPEALESWDLPLKYAKDHKADIVIANDPDGDRFGAMVRHDDEYIMLNGNELAIIMLEYRLSQLKRYNLLPESSVMINTYVSSHLTDVICSAYKVDTFKTPTGFKWMGNLISEPPYSNSEKNFIFGYESSYGFLISDFVRDKDGAQAALFFCEACNYYMHKGKSLLDVLNEIYQAHGYFYDDDSSFTFKGSAGQEKMNAVMDILKNQTVKKIADLSVLKKDNYWDRPVEIKYRTNLVKLYFSNGSWLAIRPSGTEPKLKFYICNTGLPLNELKVQSNKIKDAIVDFVNQI